MNRQTSYVPPKPQAVVWLLNALGQYPDSVATALAALKKRHPDVTLSAQDYAFTIESCAHQKKFPRAEALLKHALAEFPGAPVLYVALATIFERRGMREQAKNAVALALKNGPHDYWANYAAGMEALYARQNEKACRYFTAAVEADPQGVAALDQLSRCHLESGHYPLALRVSAAHLAAEPDNSYAYFKLAIAQIKSGALKEASATLGSLVAAASGQQTNNPVALCQDVREALLMQRRLALQAETVPEFRLSLELAAKSGLIPAGQAQELAFKPEDYRAAEPELQDMPLPALIKMSTACRAARDQVRSAINGR